MSAPWVYAAEPEGEGVDSFIEKLEKTLKEDPQNVGARYNLGTVFYHQGNYNRADEALSQALAGAGDALRQRAAYNLGSTRYRQGRIQERKDPEQAMSHYRGALKDYRLAIRQNSGDRDAQFNYELTQKRLESLKQKQDQQRQQQKEQEQKKQEQKEQEREREQGRQQSSGDDQEKAEGSQEPSSSEPETSEKGSTDPEDSESPQAGSGRSGISSEQAEWILDNFERKEQQARAQQQKKRDQREGYADKDW